MAGYSGDAGDAMASAAWPWWTSNGQKFSTRDSDNDNSPNRCAVNVRYGWWFAHCSASNLNKPTVGVWSLSKPVVVDVQASRMLVKLN